MKPKECLRAKMNIKGVQFMPSILSVFVSFELQDGLDAHVVARVLRRW